MKFTVDSGEFDPSLPLIYLWQIIDEHGEVCFPYVGKAKRGASRPMNHYVRNVRNLIAKRPYRKGNPDGYRVVHRRLADAQTRGLTVRLIFLCNVLGDEDIDDAERKWQQHYGC